MEDKCSKSTQELLESLHKNVSMGKESVMDIMSKVRGEELREELTGQLDKYGQFINEINAELRETVGRSKSESMMTKIAAKLGIEMNTLTDATEQHIAQMIIEGTTMGITDTIRLVRDYENTNCSESALKLAKSVIDFQEKTVSRMKKFL